jgi:hypothetical protein
MAEPDPLRIRYREELIQAVQKIVQGRKEPSIKNFQQLTNELVLEKDREAFNGMVLDALHRLHEGSVARYRLKLSEFQSWKSIRDRYKKSE